VSVTVQPGWLPANVKATNLFVTTGSGLGGSERWSVPGVVITPVTPASAQAGPGEERYAAACAATRLVLATAAPAGGFRQQADMPRKVRAVVYNDCGTPVGDALVTAAFSNGDSPLALPAIEAAKGVYEVPWVPGAASPSLLITLRATKAGLSAATGQVFGAVYEDGDSPVITNGGVVNAVKYVAGDPSSPGGIVAIFGRNLSSGVEQAASVPLPRTLAGARVLIGGIEAPLYYASPGQINAQVPVELAPDSQYSVVVLRGDRVSTPKPLQLVRLDPGVMAFADGRIIAQHQADYSRVSSSSPAKPGEVIFFYVVSLGSTTPAVATGEGAPASPLAWISPLPRVSIGAVEAQVLWAGLVPTAVGLYQIACKVPDSVPAGDLVVALEHAGVAANQVRLPVAR
jgi:uncharacterized protein (TIGR03437 family)